jgi:ribosome-associated toxin RatA of RatAB toxin-antitoxin module
MCTHRKRVAAAAVWLVALPWAAGHADDAERGRLDRGEIVITTQAAAGIAIPRAVMTAVIDAPPADVWRIIERCDDYERTMPRIRHATELRREGDIVFCRITVDMPFPLSDLTATTRARHRVEPGLYERAWTLVEGDYERNEGSWTLTPFDAAGARTLVRYEALAVPKVSLPDFVLEKARDGSLPDIIEGLRAQMKRPPAK